MHIPDGYLSPPTYLAMYAAMIPVWGAAARKVRRTLRSRQVPLLAIGAAFTFVVMMFNIPVPGGTSGHAVGGAIVAILLGPWAACICLTLALTIQALLFGDGGCTALAANCFTMAVVIPFVASLTYRFLSGGSAPSARRRTVAAFISGYLSLVAASLYTALLLGIQPLIASAPDGRPLYAPYPLSVTVPVLAGQHLLFFGVLEGVITALVVRYLQQADPDLLALAPAPGHSPALAKLRYALGVLAILTPLGIILPEAVHAGGAFGEWSPTELNGMLGFLPAGMARLASLWHAPFADYALPAAGGGLSARTFGYLACTLLGSALALCGSRLLFRYLLGEKGR